MAWTKDGVMDHRPSIYGPRVDGSKIRVFPTKRAAEKAARELGAYVGRVVRVQTRFQIGWTLYDSIGGGYLARDVSTLHG